MAVVTCFLPSDTGSDKAQHYYICDLQAELPIDNSEGDLAYTKDSTDLWKSTGAGSWILVTSGSGSTFPVTFNSLNQEAFTIFKGQPVTIHSSGSGVVLASASNESTLAVGLATADILSGDIGVIITVGPLTVGDWTNTAGSITLTAKKQYYLSTVAGKITISPPSVALQNVQPIGKPVNASTLNIMILDPIIVG